MSIASFLSASCTYKLPLVYIKECMFVHHFPSLLPFSVAQAIVEPRPKIKLLI